MAYRGQAEDTVDEGDLVWEQGELWRGTTWECVFHLQETAIDIWESGWQDLQNFLNDFRCLDFMWHLLMFNSANNVIYNQALGSKMSNSKNEQLKG